MSKNQLLVAAALAASLLAPASGALAADSPDKSGFYAGISLRNADGASEGVSVGHLLTNPASVWNRYTSPVAEEAGNRTLAFGGYRFANDLAVEAAVATTDRYALQPPPAGARRGVGLSLVSESDAAGKTWNVDVYGTWEFRSRFQPRNRPRR